MYPIHLSSVKCSQQFSPSASSKSKVLKQPVGSTTEYRDKPQISTNSSNCYHYTFPTKKGTKFLLLLTIQLNKSSCLNSLKRGLRLLLFIFSDHFVLLSLVNTSSAVQSHQNIYCNSLKCPSVKAVKQHFIKDRHTY